MDNHDRSNNTDAALTDAYAAIDDGYNRSTCIDSAGTPFSVLSNDLKNGLASIHDFVDRVRRSDGPAFNFVERNGRQTAQPTRLTGIPSGALVSHEFRQRYEPSEQVRIFLEAEDQFGITRALPVREPLNDCRHIRGNLVCETANEFVQLIRHKAGSKNFRRRLARRRFQAEENFRSGKALIDALFARYRKLNVLRIDFGYQTNHRASFEEAKHDFARFLNNSRRNAVFHSVVGSISHLEWAFGSGYHWHVIFFLDGSETRADSYVAQQVGKYWENRITEGRGRFHNCNADKRRYKRLGIGMIAHYDEEKRDVLVNIVLRYLTKVDELAKPRVPKGTRTFQRSQMPEPHSGIGRKRRSAGGLREIAP